MHSEQKLKLYCPDCGYVWYAVGRREECGDDNVWVPENDSDERCSRCGASAYIIQPGACADSQNEIEAETSLQFIRVRVYKAADGTINVDVHDADGAENERLTMHGFDSGEQAAAYVRDLEKERPVLLRWG